MLRMQPVLLVADGMDRYLVRFEREGAEIEYAFSISGGDIPVLQQEREYWSLTNDDPAADFLARSVLEFHEARRSDQAGQKVKLASLAAEKQASEGRHQYRVRFESGEGEVAYTITVDSAGIPISESENDSMVAVYGKTGADLLLRAISAFHCARDYPRDPSARQPTGFFSIGQTGEVSDPREQA